MSRNDPYKSPINAEFETRSEKIIDNMKNDIR